MTAHDAVVHHIVRDFPSARFDHRNELGGGGHRYVHLVSFLLLGGGVDDVLAVHIADGNAGDRAGPRNIGNRESDGGADHGSDFGRAVRVNRHHRADHGNIVAHILREQRADRPVDHAGGEDGRFGRAAFALHEGTGDLAHGVKLFFIIHRKGEEVDPVARLRGHGGGAQHGGLTIADEAGAVGQLRHFAGFHLQRAAGEFGFKNLEIFKHTKPPKYLF